MCHHILGIWEWRLGWASQLGLLNCNVRCPHSAAALLVTLYSVSSVAWDRASTTVIQTVTPHRFGIPAFSIPGFSLLIGIAVIAFGILAFGGIPASSFWTLP